MIDDANIQNRSSVRRVIFCSGKVFYDLDTGRENAGTGPVAIVRLEQFYPFPKSAIEKILASYPANAGVVWAQEEPRNMGGWTFVEDRLRL